MKHETDFNITFVQTMVREVETYLDGQYFEIKLNFILQIHDHTVFLTLFNSNLYFVILYPYVMYGDYTVNGIPINPWESEEDYERTTSPKVKSKKWYVILKTFRGVQN